MPVDPASFLDRLKRRKVAQWTIGYVSAAWLVLQFVSVVGDQFAWPGALVRGITLVLGMGLLATMTLAWFHGEKGHQRVTRAELLLLTGILVLGGFAIRAAGGRAESRDEDRAGALAHDAAAIVIVPFGAASPDSALDRLGRDLVVTLGATLDGIETLRVVDPLTVLALAGRDEGTVPLDQALRLAGRLGAARLLHGSLARAGERVRADATLYTVEGARPVARVRVEQDPQQVSALTDSIVFSLVRQVWTGSTPIIPSPAALATTSLEALRAYLDGEHALAAAEMPRALASFERAYGLDSTYFFAYWRSLYPRSYEGTRPDSATVARVVAHRDQLPPADRLLVEVQVERSAGRRLALLEEGSRRFPTHWPTWFAYANELVHWSPYLGTTYDEARAALERVVALNPQFGPAWEHLHWIAALQRDTAAVAQVLQRLQGFSSPDAYRYNDDRLLLYRIINGILANGGRFTEADVAATARYVTEHRGPIPPAAFGTGLLPLPHAQLQLGEAVLALEPGSDLAAAMWQGQALGLAAVGDWAGAVHAADNWARVSGTPDAALGAYGLLVAGAVLGLVAPAEAVARRPAAAAGFTTRGQVAELAWLDGVAAYASRDAAGLQAARQRLSPGESPLLRLLDGSLQALGTALEGRPLKAGRDIVALEDGAADRLLQGSYSRLHPYLSSVHRVLAARWLLEEGDAAEAARLMTFYEAVLPGAPPLEAVNRTVGMLGLYERARAEEAMGRHAEARRHYALFLEHVQRPVPALEPRVSDARVRLARLLRETR